MYYGCKNICNYFIKTRLIALVTQITKTLLEIKIKEIQNDFFLMKYLMILFVLVVYVVFCQGLNISV